MTFAEISHTLRDASDRYGGIKRYLSAAGELDRTICAFFKEQTVDSLRDLNGALAAAERCRKELASVKEGVVG